MNKPVFVNLTPHPINLNTGGLLRVYPPSGNVARVSSTHSQFDENGIASLSFGEVQGLPEPQEGVFYIVSAMVAQAAKIGRAHV